MVSAVVAGWREVAEEVRVNERMADDPARGTRVIVRG